MTRGPAGAGACHLDALFALLERQQSLAGGLLRLLAEERRALLAADVEGIAALAREKTRLSAELASCDQRLAELLAGRSSGGNGEGEGGPRVIDLSALADRLGDSGEAARLRAMRDELRAARAAIREANDINRRLVAETLAFLQDAVDLLTGGGGGYPARRGRRPASRGPAFVSRQV